METVNSYDIIISFIASMQSNVKDAYIKSPEGLIGNLGNNKYIFNQILRHIWINPENVFVSEEALALSTKLEIEDEIFNYHYREKVTCNNEDPIELRIYKGASNDYLVNQFGKTKNKYFTFRDIFHIDHIIPISTIVEKLMSINLSKDKEVIYRDVDSILNNISICYLTKKEDRELNKIGKSKRYDTLDECLSITYKQAAINVIRRLKKN